MRILNILVELDWSRIVGQISRELSFRVRSTGIKLVYTLTNRHLKYVKVNYHC